MRLLCADPETARRIAAVVDELDRTLGGGGYEAGRAGAVTTLTARSDDAGRAGREAAIAELLSFALLGQNFRVEAR